MKIIQMLWSTLMSENMILTTIFSTMFTGIEIYLFYLIISVLLDTTLSYKKQILFIFLLVVIGVFTSLFIPYPFHSFINLFFSVILSIIIFKSSLVKIIVSTFCFYALMFFTNIVWATFYGLLFKFPSSMLNQVLLYKIIFATSVYISLYIFYKLCKKYSLNFNFLTKLKNYKMLLFNLFLGLLTIIAQFMIAFLYFDYIPILITIFSSMLLLAYFLISIFSLYRTNKLETTKQLLEKEKLYNKTLSTLHDNIRGFKHDFNNIVQALGGYISTNNIDGLKNYYKDLLEDCQFNNNLASLTPDSIDNPAVYSLLTDKYYKAESCNVKLNLELLDDLSCLNIKPYELARILGILLDNAIEASAKTTEKVINVIFRKDKKVNRNLIIIENSYENKDVNIDKIFEKGYTSKISEDKHGHGLGLWEIRKYLRKHTSLNLYTTKSDSFFRQQFEIYND